MNQNKDGLFLLENHDDNTPLIDS